MTTQERTYSISDLIAAHADGRVILAPVNGPGSPDLSKRESAEDWYDAYGAHESSENHGDICVQRVEYGWLDDNDDETVVALVLADLPDPIHDDDAEDLQAVAEGLVEKARDVRAAADSIESLLDDAVEAFGRRDVDATLEALRVASDEESEHGDDPATQMLIHALCIITPEE